MIHDRRVPDGRKWDPGPTGQSQLATNIIQEVSKENIRTDALSKVPKVTLIFGS